MQYLGAVVFIQIVPSFRGWEVGLNLCLSVVLHKFCQLAGLNFKHLLLQVNYWPPVIEA